MLPEKWGLLEKWVEGKISLKCGQLQTYFQNEYWLLPSCELGKSGDLKQSFLQIYLFLQFLLKTLLYVI